MAATPDKAFSGAGGSAENGNGSAEERAKMRHKRIAFSTVTAGATKLTSILTIFITAPLCYRYLGAERYGMWMAIVSLVTMLCFADLGIGNGLLTLISEADGKDDPRLVRRYVSSAVFLLSALAVLLVAAAGAFYPLIPWHRLFSVTTAQAARESGPSFLALIFCLAISMPLGVTQRIHAGYQEGYVSSLWNALGNLLSLGLVIASIFFHLSLPWLVLGVAGGPALALLLNTVWLFGWNKPWLMPSVAEIRRDICWKVLHMGLLFFVLQSALAIGFSSDSLVIARILGAEKVADYSVTARLFTVLPVLMNVALIPLWPAYGEAFARGDVMWLKKTLVRSLRWTVAAALLINTVLVVAAHWILRLWIGPQVQASHELLLGLWLSQTLAAVFTPLSIFLNGLKVLRFQAVCFSLMAALNICASIFLTRRIGVSGVVYGSVIAQLLCLILPTAIYVPRLLRRLERPAPQLESMESL
ncbi:MAG: oligosaccharide flippase family protein [Acidobacteriota bacterium]|nr:oligosaccharide flippase family protein [Acidobacteriota bacterium]